MSIFNTLSELLEDIFHRNLDGKKLDDVAKSQTTMQADLLSIKAFLGVPDVRIGATQEQVDALGAKLQGEVKSAEQFDETIPK